MKKIFLIPLSTFLILSNSFSNELVKEDNVVSKSEIKTIEEKQNNKEIDKNKIDISFYNDTEEEKIKVKKLFGNNIPKIGTRIMSPQVTTIISASLGESVVTTELHNNAIKNMNYPLFINDIFYGMITNVSINENGYVEYLLNMTNDIRNIYQENNENNYWNKDFVLEERYIKNLIYPIEYKKNWENMMNGYYPVEGSKFISTNHFNIQVTDDYVTTNEKLMYMEMNKNINKPLFINGIYKGIIDSIIQSNNNIIYLLKPSVSIDNIYEKTPQFDMKRLNIFELKEVEELLKNDEITKEKYEEYKNIQKIEQVESKHLNYLNKILGFTPELGSKFISTNNTIISSLDEVGESKFLTTVNERIVDFSQYIGKKIFINGFYQGVIEKMYYSGNNEIIYKIKGEL